MKRFLSRLSMALCALGISAMLAVPALAAEEITVSAAASLTNAFTEVKDAFVAKNPGVQVNLNFAASNPLLKQIQEGAPVDVFASADQPTMDKAVASKVVDPSTRKNFALNDLVMIVPKGAAKPAKVADVLKLKRVSVGNPDSVPAGRYTREALQSAKIWDDLQKNQPVLGNSVRQVLDYVSKGEVDCGFVYATDAKQNADKVDVAMKMTGHTPVSYPIAVAVTGKNPKMGQKFLDFVLSSEGQTILGKFGFAKP
ncbi:MAG: molybdate ABC transporter substrate-binding protein [Desulfovibrio sp.]|nr:molybdate ABC transporter substrate-binding protein [Desulfovibrio sp.]